MAPYLRFWGPDVAADVDDEIGFHLAQLERDLIASGLEPAEAREEARARFGDPDTVARWLRTHDSRQLRRSERVDALGDLLQDARYALRRLRAAPAFTLAVVLVLAAGIGATTAIFGVIDVLLLRALPYLDAERLVAVRDLQGSDETPASFPEYLDWKEQSDVFAETAAYFTTTLALTGRGEPEMLRAAQMSANLPRLLGVEPRLGRSFAPGEDDPAAERVVMISEDLWRRRFGGDPGLIGTTLTLADQSYTVIGVVPGGGRSIVPRALAAGRRHDLWLPLRLTADDAPRGLHYLDVIARLDPGPSPVGAGGPALDLAGARDRIASLARRLQQEAVTDHGIQLVALEHTVVGESRPLLFALAGAVAMLLLIACTNVANLLLARSAARQREIAVRAALGAPRWRLVRQLLVESLLLALLGGAAGVAVAWGAVATLRQLAPGSVPRLAEAAIDGRVLGFALAVSIVTGLLFGLLPALRSTGGDLAAAAYVNNLPLDGGVNGTVVIEGREFPPDAEPLAEKRIVSPGYFDVLGTPVLAGRAFDQRDRPGAAAVTIVNEAFASRFFPGESALGKRIEFGWEIEGLQEIVGVVADVRERALHLPAQPTTYVPYAQRPEEDGFLVVRASGDPHQLVPALRAAVTTLDPTLPLSEVRTLEAVLAEGLAERRLATSLLGVFSLVSLALAAIGLYAVISYTVLQRRQEIGIRMALGARGRQVIGVDAADPFTFAGTALLLVAIALLASIVPALRAARLDPSSVLRSE